MIATTKNTIPIILAAGKGSRMGTVKNKCLLKICGKSLIEWTIETLRKAGFSKIIVVTRSTDNDVKKLLDNKNISDVSVVYDPFFMGAGHALFLGTTILRNQTKYILTLYGDDSFLYSSKTLRSMLHTISKTNSRFQLTTIRKKGALKLGGLSRNDEGFPIGVYTKEDLIEMNMNTSEIVCGCFLFRFNWLKRHFPKIVKSEKSGELILTSLIQLSFEERTPASVFELKNDEEWCGANTPEELKTAKRILYKRIATN